MFKYNINIIMNLHTMQIQYLVHCITEYKQSNLSVHSGYYETETVFVSEIITALYIPSVECVLWG